MRSIETSVLVRLANLDRLAMRCVYGHTQKTWDNLDKVSNKSAASRYNKVGNVPPYTIQSTTITDYDINKSLRGHVGASSGLLIREFGRGWVDEEAWW